MQDLTGLDWRLGVVRFEDLGEPCDQIACHLDAHSNALAITDGLQRLLKMSAEVQCDSVCSLGGMQRASVFREMSFEGAKFSSYCVGKKNLVNPTFHIGH